MAAANSGGDATVDAMTRLSFHDRRLRRADVDFDGESMSTSPETGTPLAALAFRFLPADDFLDARPPSTQTRA